MSNFKHYLEAVQNKNEDEDENKDEVKVEDKANFVRRRPGTLSRGVVFKKPEGNWTFKISYNDVWYEFYLEKVTVENLKEKFLNFLETTVTDHRLKAAVEQTIKNYPERWYFDYFPGLADHFPNLKPNVS